MRPALADTSFIFALYGQDAHSAAARNHVQPQVRPITVTTLQRYEFANAVRFAAFRKVITVTDAQAIQAAFEADLLGGYVSLAPCDLEAVLHEAQWISAHHTLSGGHRSFDILHVATAKILRAAEFLTFDSNQRKLGKAVGLTAGP
jgi:predicted nucleic acid-binding protein